MSKTKVFYDIVKYTSDSFYSHLEVRVYTTNNFDSLDDAFVFAWQGDKDHVADGWYAGKVKIEAKWTETLTQKANLAKRVMKDLNIYSNPHDVITRLESLGATRVIYDSRVSKHVAINDVQPADKLRFMDDYPTLGKNYCSFATLAYNEKEAQREILKKAAKHNKVDFIALFVERGQPVRIDYNSKAPVLESIDDILKI